MDIRISDISRRFTFSSDFFARVSALRSLPVSLVWFVFPKWLRKLRLSVLSNLDHIMIQQQTEKDSAISKRPQQLGGSIIKDDVVGRMDETRGMHESLLHSNLQRFVTEASERQNSFVPQCEFILEVIFSTNVRCKIKVSNDIPLEDLVTEIKLAARLTPSQEARLLMIGLNLECDGIAYGPVSTQAEWHAIAKNLHGFATALIPPPPINFDCVDYSLSRSIEGHGGFGSVYRCMHMKSGFVFSAKVVTQTRKQSLHDLYKEVTVMSSLQHEHIVSYFGAQYCNNTEGTTDLPHVRIFMEHCNGSLRRVLEEFDRLPEQLAQHLTYQILRALAYLDSEQYVHMDVKPENVLIDAHSRRLKLCDFGLSIHLPQKEQMASNPGFCAGTPSFMAPELISEGRYGHKSDIWALGCTVLTMLVGPSTPLYNFSSPFALFYNVGHKNTRPTIPAGCSKSTADFLNQCFIEDWTSRPDAATLLRHSFIIEPIRYSAPPAMPPLPALHNIAPNPVAPTPSGQPISNTLSFNITNSTAPGVMPAEGSVVSSRVRVVTQLVAAFSKVPHVGFAPAAAGSSAAPLQKDANGEPLVLFPLNQAEKPKKDNVSSQPQRLATTTSSTKPKIFKKRIRYVPFHHMRKQEQPFINTTLMIDHWMTQLCSFLLTDEETNVVSASEFISVCSSQSMTD